MAVQKSERNCHAMAVFVNNTPPIESFSFVFVFVGFRVKHIIDYDFFVIIVVCDQMF